LKKLGFFDTRSVPGWEGVTPRRFLVRHLEPRLRYQPDDKDVAAMYNVFEGEAGGRKKRLVNHLLIERDMETGLMAMAQGVGYTASITAQMLAGGVIDRPGLLSPVVDVPYEPFVAALAERGIRADARETFV
jgi:saccharopine dehydrogenase-like NADP-dependent oxidoreductase